MKKSWHGLAVCLLAVGCSKNVVPGGAASVPGVVQSSVGAGPELRNAAPVALGAPATLATTPKPTDAGGGAVVTAQFLAGQTWRACPEVQRILRSSPSAALQQAESTACSAQQALRGKKPRPLSIGQVEKMTLSQLREVASCPWYRGLLGDRAALRMVALISRENRPMVLRPLRGKASCRGVPGTALASYGVAYDAQGISAQAEKRIQQLTEKR